jgi:hypothetical protein
MAVASIENDFLRDLGAQFELVPEGGGRYRVDTPFSYLDGDGPVIVLEQRDGGWVLSDCANSEMRLSLDHGSDSEVIDYEPFVTPVLTAFRIEDHDGEFVLPITDEHFGQSLCEFVQALLLIDGLRHFRRQ